MCKRDDLTLPEFLSRKDQEEFIAVLKNSKHLFPIEAAYIGLKQDRQEVSHNKIFFPCFHTCLFISVLMK